MNLSQLQAAIQAKGYGTDTAAYQTQFINEAYRELCGMQRWAFLEAEDTSLSTAVGQTDYTLTFSNQWRNLDAVRLEIPAIKQYTNLKYTDPQSWLDDWHMDRDVSTPFYWTFANQKLRLYPAPDQVYTIRVNYIIEPADLSAGSDVPLIPIQYHDILVWGAIKSLAFRERDWLGRQFAETEKQSMVTKLLEEYQVRQRQSGSHVKKSGAFATQSPYPFSVAGQG